MDTQLSDSLEEYIETIYYICRRKEVARASEIAAYMGVRRSSVTRALQQLSSGDMICYTKYRRVYLTERGLAYATEILQKIRCVYTFLHFVLGMDTEKADETALSMRKRLNSEALERIKLFLSHHARSNPHVHADCRHNKERCMLCQISDRKKAVYTQ